MHTSSSLSPKQIINMARKEKIMKKLTRQEYNDLIFFADGIWNELKSLVVNESLLITCNEWFLDKGKTTSPHDTVYAYAQRENMGKARHKRFAVKLLADRTAWAIIRTADKTI